MESAQIADIIKELAGVKAESKAAAEGIVRIENKLFGEGAEPGVLEQLAVKINTNETTIKNYKGFSNILIAVITVVFSAVSLYLTFRG